MFLPLKKGWTVWDSLAVPVPMCTTFPSVWVRGCTQNWRKLMMCWEVLLLGIMSIQLKKGAPNASILELTLCRFKHVQLMNQWPLFINVVITSVVIVGVSRLCGKLLHAEWVLQSSGCHQMLYSSKALSGFVYSMSRSFMQLDILIIDDEGYYIVS